jgi:hypothetical protein
VSFTIDFLEGEDVSADDLFSNKRGASITLGHTKDHLTYLLPDDEHFSSKQLLRYFMKPIFSVSTLSLSLLVWTCFDVFRMYVRLPGGETIATTPGINLTMLSVRRTKG